jgi:IclR family transcriptional regulator, acetate operon repressor
LDDVRTKGYASVEDENILGISSVGAPVRDAAGRICAAISVSYSRHFTPELGEASVAQLVLAAARAISHGVGDRNRA